jgi:serine/threonine protein kinase
LPFDDESVQILFKKIRSGVYSTPDYLSRPVAQLIEKMLTVDPLKRATVKDIREHDWFKINLPDYLFPKPSQENLNIIDNEAVHEICEVNNFYVVYHHSIFFLCIITYSFYDCRNLASMNSLFKDHWQLQIHMTNT